MFHLFPVDLFESRVREQGTHCIWLLMYRVLFSIVASVSTLFTETNTLETAQVALPIYILLLRSLKTAQITLSPLLFVNSFTVAWFRVYSIPLTSFFLLLPPPHKTYSALRLSLTIEVTVAKKKTQDEVFILHNQADNVIIIHNE